MKPPCTERYARWCERTGVNHPLLLDFPVFSMMGNFPVIRTELRLLFEKNFSIGNFPIRNFPVIRTEQIGEPINTA